MTRLDAGRLFLVSLYATILASWYPLQETYVSASREPSAGVAVGLAAAIAAARWGEGTVVDVVVAAAAAAAGAATGLALGAALVVGLSSATPFYASVLDPNSLWAALAGESIAFVTAAAIGGLVGAIGASLASDRSGSRLSRRTTRSALAIAAVGVTLSLAIAVVGISQVVPVVTGAANHGSPVVSDGVRVVALALTTVATGSALFVRVFDEGRVRVQVSFKRLVLAAVLAMLPSATAALYESFVLHPA